MRADRFESFELLLHALRSRVRGELEVYAPGRRTVSAQTVLWQSADNTLAGKLGPCGQS